jgi:hypothetical protein
LPIVAALAAVGLAQLPELAQKAAMALVFGAALYSGARFHELTFGQLGQYEDLRPNSSAYDDFGVVNRLLLAAHEQRDLCGLKIELAHISWTGGYTYLHRPVPLYSSFQAGRESGFFNYAITYPQPGVGQVVATEAGLALVRLHPGGCVKDPSYSPRLP